MNYQLVKKSSNKKVGPIPVSNSHRGTCPPSCPLQGAGGCYAEAGYYTRLNWDKVDSGERGTDWDGFTDQVSKLPKGQLWRHNVSGDLPADKPDHIDSRAVVKLVSANKGKRGFTYTHYPMGIDNATLVKWCNEQGFTINASANTKLEAMTYHKRGLPTVCTISRVEHGDEWKGFNIGDVHFVQCPAEYRQGVSCATCKLCSVASREVVVGFTVHGARAPAADVIARG